MVVCLGIAGCSPVQNQADERATQIECALGPGSEFAAACMVEREGEILVIRHPDGSFRRLRMPDYSEADGSQTANANIGDQTVEVQLADDRYRWEKGTIDD